MTGDLEGQAAAVPDIRRIHGQAVGAVSVFQGDLSRLGVFEFDELGPKTEAAHNQLTRYTRLAPKVIHLNVKQPKSNSHPFINKDRWAVTAIVACSSIAMA